MQALLDRLKNVDVDKRIEELQESINKKKHRGPKAVDKDVKALKALTALKEQGLTPYEAYTRETVPIIPAQYRAPIQLPNDTFMVPDVNNLIKDVGLISETLKEIAPSLPKEELEKSKAALYKRVSALQGLETPEVNNQIVKNYFTSISGAPGPAKTGYYQTALTKKRVDLSGRGVISPNPQLDMDQVEIPIDMGLTMYKPFIKRELISRGFRSKQADDMIESKDKRAIDALNRAGKQRPVILNRAPSIGKGSVTAHWPTFVDKLNVNIPNSLALLQKADFDGDAIGVHVPISDAAVKEAENMMPSRNLYDDVSSKIGTFPDHSAALGIYKLSKTPEGRDRINKYLPAGRQIKTRIDKPTLVDLLSKMAKEDSEGTARVVDKLIRLGDSHSYQTGFSLGLEDFEPLTDIREKVLYEIKRDMSLSKKKDDATIREIYKKNIDKATDEIGKHFKGKDSRISDIVNSKARGSSSQLRDILLSPIAVNAAEAIDIPIAHSYAEGLKPSEYFAAAAGGRAGTISKSQGTSKPGALGNLLFANTNMLVINKDKGKSMGVIELPLDDPNELIDRYVGKDVNIKGKTIIKEGTLVEPRTIQLALKNGLKNLPVYTPLRSSSIDGGIPAMAYGLMPGSKLPEVGYNIGTHSAAGVVAPLYTASMGSFHTGGSLDDEKSGYPRLKQVLELAKVIPNKATLAASDGMVDNIVKDSLGGHKVSIEGVEHYVSPGNKLNIKEGVKVKMGDTLSSGSIDPRDLAKYKGMDAAQSYMVDEIVKNTPGNIRRRAAEVIVEGITRYGEVIDPGMSEYLPGDIKLISDLEHRNQKQDQGIEYEPVFRGVNTLPSYTQSWMSKLNFRNLRKNLANDIATAAETDVSSYEPVPALAIGKDFGKGEQGRY